jgi:predicted secreted hydrolase
MMKQHTVIAISLILAGLTLAGWVLARPPAPPEIDAELVGLRGNNSIEGFARALKPRTFQFPADHGPHPEYQTEWWYYTGNLDTDTGRHFDGAQYRHFGYQLTFFRRALTPTAPDRASDWGTNQVYMAHFAVTDVAGGRFHNFERFSRGAAGLAGATGNPYHVWLESWSVVETEPGVVRLRAAEGDVKLDLTLQQVKPPALHGQAGLSQKSSTPGNASYYYSLTRIETTGTVTVGGQSYAVQGSSWMDHEFGTSFLADNQVGWDWFSLQLDDGRELMVFQIRQDDGGIEPLSGGSLIDTDGTVRHLNRDDVIIQVLGRWTSPHTGATYPAGWHVSVPVAGLELDVQPFASDQELTVSYAYWEGAVQVRGSSATGPATGAGYVELTGYAGSMQGQF